MTAVRYSRLARSGVRTPLLFQQRAIPRRYRISSRKRSYVPFPKSTPNNDIDTGTPLFGNRYFVRRYTNGITITLRKVPVPLKLRNNFNKSSRRGEPSFRSVRSICTRTTMPFSKRKKHQVRERGTGFPFPIPNYFIFRGCSHDVESRDISM